MSLVIDRIGKNWGGVHVLRDVSLEVDGRGITGLIGPNGAGKSTLFGVISGNVKPEEGTISFEGVPLDRLSPVERARKGLLRTFQVPRPFINLTVRENLAVAARDVSGERLRNVFFRPSRVRQCEKDIASRLAGIIDVLNLRRVADVVASQLSGGQLKLLELGRLLMTEPRMILLDEPFAGVNPILTQEISQRIRDVNSQGVGFFIVEHDLAALSSIVKTLYAMDGGVLIAQGSPEEVLGDPKVHAAYVGGATNAAAA